MGILSGGKRIKVLVVDDSAIVRKILKKELNSRAGIEVVGTAADPYIAREKIVQLNPDVLTLDVEMPRMDGLTFLRKLMAAHPMPVIVLSSLGDRNGLVALEALEIGALDVVRKPGSSFSVQDTCDEVARLILSVSNGFRPWVAPAAPARTIPSVASGSAMIKTTQKIIAIGASTGGVQSLSKVFNSLPATAPGIVVVQHMPPRFTALFAERLNETCAMTVKEAAHGDRVLPGHILIAPGGQHMTLSRSGTIYNVMLNKDELVCRQRPSVDVLFSSVAKYAGVNAVGAILTGMGSDGAAGLLEMKQAGAKTVAQDEASSIVFGMPKEAIKLGGADRIASLDNMANVLLDLAGE